MKPIPGEDSKRLEADINLAARSSAPVLITAAPLDALNIARRIAARGDRQSPPEVLICDPTAGDDVVAAMANARQRIVSDRRTHILLMRDVQVLSSTEQAAVYERLAEGHSGPPDSSTRIIASSSIDLYACVARGGFDARLFYRLNAIHIVAPSWSDAMATV